MTTLTPHSTGENLIDPVDDYLYRLASTIGMISRQQVWAVVEVLFSAWRTGNTIYLIGNGGSAATASHMANDLNKYTLVPGKPRMRALALTDNVPLMTAWSNDTDYEYVFSEQLLNYCQPGDVLIAISTSGNSPNIIHAVNTARSNQVITIGFTGMPGGELKLLVDHLIMIPDEQIGRQEDGHMILDHVIANTLYGLISKAEHSGGNK